MSCLNMPSTPGRTSSRRSSQRLKRSCSGKLRCSALGAVQWVEDPQIPEGSQYIRASKPTFAGMMATYNRRRELIAQKQLALARDETGKAKLELAEKYRAYLAASWALWCGMRRGNARQLRINLNIWRNDALVRVLCQVYLVYFIYALLVFYERLFFWGPKVFVALSSKRAAHGKLPSRL